MIFELCPWCGGLRVIDAPACPGCNQSGAPATTGTATTHTYTPTKTVTVSTPPTPPYPWIDLEEDPEVTFDFEEKPLWKHGYCDYCGIEMVPAMDGDCKTCINCRRSLSR